MKTGVVLFDGVGTGVTTANTGAEVSIVKDGIWRTDETFPAASVTVIVQFVYVPSANVLSVTVLLPLVAEPVADEQEPPYVMEPSSVEENVTSGVVSLPGVGTGVTIASTGATVSITNVGTDNAALAFPAASVTVIVQSEYVPCANVLNVTVLFPLVAETSAAEHEPPYVIVPAFVELNVKLGVVSWPGVGTGVTTASTGADVSIVKEGTCNTDETFPAASVTVIVQSVYVPSTSVLNVTLLLPVVADGTADEQEPPYVIDPASVDENVKLGVVSWPGVGTGVTTARTGATVSIVKDGTGRTDETFPAASVTVIVQSV